MIQRILSSLQFRLKLARFGLYYLSGASLDLSKLRIGGTPVTLSLPEGEGEVLQHELFQILFADCYALETFARDDAAVGSVLDVGANVGLFSMAARHYFPKAAIQAYEPNGDLAAFLGAHLRPLGVRYYMEAVGGEAGTIVLSPGANSLHSVASSASEASGEGVVVAQTAFRTALDRLGGTADLVKLDCEGAEWSILEDADAWATVRHLTMEYHLWAREGSTFEDLLGLVERLGFQCWNHEPSPSGLWGLLQASKDSPAAIF
jgi:FkbM family methyltransferase